MGRAFERGVTALYVFLPLALLAKFLLHDETLLFIFPALAIIPFARMMGHGTGALAARAGSGVGAFLNRRLETRPN